NFHPGATETDCSDPSDYNCDGSTGWADADSDGSAACEDCDDNDASAYPGNPEVCDFIDNDCNSSIDEGFDVDADGWTTCDGDCDDTDAAVNPDAIEVCDSVDNDCDGTTDTGSLVGDPWYPDADSDGYGEETSTPTYSCSALSGYSLDATDCDDTDALANPGVTEIYAEYGDGIDQDCNGADDIWFVTDGETFCVTANVFDGCYASGNAYLYGDSPFGGWTGRLSSAGYMTLSATAVGFYCFDFYVAYGGTPRIYEFVLVSDKSAADTTCATSVNTTSSSDWVYAGIDAYCASGTDPYGYCDTDRHSSDSTICLYEDGTDGTTPESCH
ncbi:MAG: putative metal-binding motif-containing protein, partial [Patescibacteria group bacterium]